MNVVAVVQARLGSSRLPNKVLMDVEGKPMLARVVERARLIPKVDTVVVAIPSDELLLRDWCWAQKIPVVIGHPTDVLRRFWTAARVGHADVVVRITGDCPLLDPALSGRVVAAYFSGALPMITDNVGPAATDGFETEVFSRNLLDLAHHGASRPYDREHVTSWMYDHASHRRGHLEVEGDPAQPPLSVNTAEDLERVRAIYREMKGDVFSRREALAALTTITAAR